MPIRYPYIRISPCRLPRGSSWKWTRVNIGDLPFVLPVAVHNPQFISSARPGAEEKMAVMAPENIGHLHYWTVELARDASRDEVLAAFSRNTRIAFIRASEGITALNVTADLMLELERPRGAMWEVALWEDILTVEGREAYYAYQVDN